MKLHIIVGSNRTARVTDRVAKWVEVEAKALADAEPEIVDLVDYPMPFFDEAISPKYNPNRSPSPEAKKWLDKVAEADAYVIVTPEYNRSYPAVLKNALDYLDYQMAKKPILLVGHGSTGGAQAVASLRIASPATGGVVLSEAVFLNFRAGEMIDEEGSLNEELKANPYGPQAGLHSAIESLKWYSDALSTARAQK